MMNLKSTAFIIVLYLLLVAISGCKGNLNEPSEFDADVYPEKPLNLEALVGDGIIVLNWSHPALGKVSSFNIYRKDGEGADSKKIGSTAALTYKDINLRNGVSYVYRISAVGKNGLEGSKSDSVTAVPAVFSVNINSGREFTNSKTVTLTMTAPGNTLFMLISNDSLFAGSQWQTFVPQWVWTLSDGDGMKFVHVKIRDSEGRESYEPANDKIILDTKAIIREVTENTNGQIMLPLQSIHFGLDAGEPNGKATVEIFDEETNSTIKRIVLFDDGTAGDSNANDGIYEKKYFIPEGTNVNNARIIGRFTDKAGNVASPEETVGRVTIHDPPSSVTLFEPEVNEGSIILNWSQSANNDFIAYKVFRARIPGLNIGSKLLSVIDSKTTTSYKDSELEDNTLYFYRVFVFDNQGNSTGSNEVSVTSAPNKPPVAVILTQPTQVDSATFRLNWTQSTIADFGSYRLYRSQTSPVDTTGAPVGIINNDPSITFYDDTGLQENIQYSYRVFVFDQGGLSAGSNEVRGRLNN